MINYFSILDGDYSGTYVNEITEYGTKGDSDSNGKGPNTLSRNQEVLVRSAIKYWVERHKHIVKYDNWICFWEYKTPKRMIKKLKLYLYNFLYRYVGLITDCYGGALLCHMIVSTVILTILAYQATKVCWLALYRYYSLLPW